MISSIFRGRLDLNTKKMFTSKSSQIQTRCINTFFRLFIDYLIVQCVHEKKIVFKKDKT